MQLVKIQEITGKIILKSGLHIGAGDTEMRIGGTDNPVVKHPHTLLPYIPGSSLKGKVRSLLELRSGLMGRTKGAPLTFKHLQALQQEEEDTTECEKILKLFGCSGADTNEDYYLGPTRVAFADCHVHSAWREKASQESLAYTEIKAETAIDRITGTAKTGSLRQTERVIAGTEFDFKVSLKKFDGDEDMLPLLLEGLKLLEQDALGGSCSRGYGRIEIVFDDPEIRDQYDAIQPV